MDRKLFGILSGAHVTLIALGAMLTPAALYASVTFSNVSLVNPTTGVPAAVDGAGRLYVLDPYALYRNYPGNQIDLTVSNHGGGCEASQQWTVPSGKAFIMTAMSGYEQMNASQDPAAGVILFTGANCTGKIFTEHQSSFTTEGAIYAPIAVEYGVGIPVPAGSIISVRSLNNGGTTYIHGYLVPAAVVSPSQIIGSTDKGG